MASRLKYQKLYHKQKNMKQKSYETPSEFSNKVAVPVQKFIATQEITISPSLTFFVYKRDSLFTKIEQAKEIKPPTISTFRKVCSTVLNFFIMVACITTYNQLYPPKKWI